MHGNSPSGVGPYEDLFVARYDMLRRWARQLVGRDRAHAADDLVHAAFLRFVQRRPLLTSIGNLDSYLFSLVRNLLVSDARRASAQLEASFVSLDEDMGIADVRDVAVSGPGDAQAMLVTICEYAVHRKETSKAGSVLLLRFLWGYYPAELARLARTSAPAINQWLRIARQEARAYVDHPAPASSASPALQAWRAAMASPRGPNHRGADYRGADHRSADQRASDHRGAEHRGANHRGSDHIVQDLRAALARTRQTPCPQPEWYYALYAGPDGRTVDAEALAHLASCASCQHLVTAHLGLRPPEDPGSRLGRNNRSAGGRATPAGRSNGTARPGGRTRRAAATIGRAARRCAEALSPRAPARLVPAGLSVSRLMAAVGAIVAAITLWHAWDRSASTVSAASVLRDLRTTEAAAARASDLATHRTLVLERRRLPQRQVISRQRVELWQSAARGVRARRVYDAQQRLVAGEWTLADGTQRLYGASGAPGSGVTTAVVPFGADTAWRWEPSAIDFDRLGVAVDRMTIEDRADAYVLRFRAPASHVGDGVVEATLTVTKPDRRAIEQRVVVREAMALHEYHFREVGYDRVPAPRAPREAFEPDSALLGSTAIAAPAAPSSRSMAPVRVRPASPIYDARLDAAELGAIFGLHRLESCLSEVPQLARGASRLRVEAAVKDTACADRARTLFADLDPAIVEVRLDVRAPGSGDGEGIGDPRDETPTLAERAVERLDRMDRMDRMDRGGRVDGPLMGEHAIRDAVVASQLAHAQAHAQAVQRLAQLWPIDRLQQVDLDARLQWQGMIREHAWQVRQAADRLAAVLRERDTVRADNDARPDNGASKTGDSGDVTIDDLRGVGPAADRLVVALGEVTRALRDRAAAGNTVLADTAHAVDAPRADAAHALRRLSRTAGAFLDVWALDAARPAELH